MMTVGDGFQTAAFGLARVQAVARILHITYGAFSPAASAATAGLRAMRRKRQRHCPNARLLPCMRLQ